MRTLLLCLVVFFLFLIWERFALRRAQSRIALRIAVTGTRGKSSVARLLAAILKADGRRVVAKTTGSEARILLPDGSEIELDRTVSPSILEQKQLIHRAARLKADCLVAEVMSLRPENHFVESRLLLRPNLVAITNVRRDHTDIMGETENGIASVLSLDICPGSAVFLPAHEAYPSFRAEAERCGATLTLVAGGFAADFLQKPADLSGLEFSENLDLVCAVVKHLGIRAPAILEGIRKTQHDVGRLRLWRYHPGGSEHTVYLVNAFAANDPASTWQVLGKITAAIPDAAGNVVGVFNLRADRLPRTLQWISVLRDGAQRPFKKVYLVGDHSRVIRRRLPEAHAIRSRSPEEITELVSGEGTEPTIVFGFGNIKGPGKLLAEHWSRIGEPFGNEKQLLTAEIAETKQ
jgi:poly-gamma-glutamate synthase PgsB/CapB